jgi:hypothetical protein
LLVAILRVAGVFFRLRLLIAALLVSAFEVGVLLAFPFSLSFSAFPGTLAASNKPPQRKATHPVMARVLREKSIDLTQL